MGKENLAWSSPRSIILLIGVLGLISIAIVSILREKIVYQQYRQVTITGQGKVAYEPDLAIVTLGIQVDKASTSEDALNQLNEKMNKVIAAVKAEKIKNEDITTANYSLAPQYDYKDNISTVSGYNANEQLIIKVRGYDKDVNGLSHVIAAASKAGANQVSGLSFDASNINDIKQQARMMAMSDAKSKSKILAAAAGVELEDITGWYENPIQVPAPMYSYAGAGGMGGGGGASPQIPNGSKEVIIEMNLTYNLK